MHYPLVKTIFLGLDWGGPIQIIFRAKGLSRVRVQDIVTLTDS